MDDPISQLANYKLQLGQVEAALTADPNNQEMIDLKKDLDEIIEMTNQMITDHKKTAIWRIGMSVQAPYSDDGKLYEAIINQIDENAGTAKVTFAQYGNSETVLISQLNKFDGKRTVKGSRWQDESEMARAPLPSTHMDKMAGNIMVGDGINKNAAREKQRIEIEKRRKKAQKKKERLAAMDAAGERQKKSWQSFANKMVKKNKTGVTKSSIFQTPEGNKGMVGVGTCGIGDTDMTANPSQARYNARHLAPNSSRK